MYFIFVKSFYDKNNVKLIKKIIIIFKKCVINCYFYFITYYFMVNLEKIYSEKLGKWISLEKQKIIQSFLSKEKKEFYEKLDVFFNENFPDNKFSVKMEFVWD